MTDDEWISPDEKRRRERAEQEAAAERQRAERQSKATGGVHQRRARGRLESDGGIMKHTHKAPDAEAINKATKKVKRRGKGEGDHKSKGEPKANGAAPPNSEPVSDGEPDMAAFDPEIARLAKLGVLAYAQQRGDVAKRFKVPVGFIDKTVTALRSPTKPTIIPEITPWPDPVDGAALLDEIKAIIIRHIKLPTRAEEAVALWIVFSHCLDATNIAPALAITSPTIECGKTTLLDLIMSMVARPLSSSSISAAAVYRATDELHPTLLLDEVDTFLPENEALRGILNSSHRRGGASIRCEGDTNELRRFSTWCALVVALVGKLPASLASRSIPIKLQRLKRGETVERFRWDKAPYAHLARKAARWAADNIDTLRDAEPEMPEALQTRRGDNWRPLLAVADRAGGAWGGSNGLAREAALTLHGGGNDSDDLLTLLLADIRSILTELGEDDRVASAELAKKLGKMEGRPWPEFGRSKKEITVNALARLLKSFNIAPTKLRFSNPNDGLSETAQGYYVEPLQAVFDRYLPPLS